MKTYLRQYGDGYSLSVYLNDENSINVDLTQDEMTELVDQWSRIAIQPQVNCIGWLISGKHVNN